MLGRRLIFFLLVACLVRAVAPAFAASHKDPSCSVSPNPAAVGQTYVVSASGLPTGSAVNLWVTDPNGTTWGSPLGSTPDGTFALNEASSSAGKWTYSFTGPTKNHTQVYATCSVEAS